MLKKNKQGNTKINKVDTFSANIISSFIGLFAGAAYTWAGEHGKFYNTSYHRTSALMFSIMRGKSYSNNGFNPLPVSQCFPVNPRLQVHLYLRSGSISQVPLIHGFFIHGVISQLAPLNPGGQRQRRYPRLFTHVPLLLQPCWVQ